MTDERRPIEYPATIDIKPIGTNPHVRVDLRDAIIAVQSAGYLVYEKSELPEVIKSGPLQGGKPKLPADWGQPSRDRTRTKAEVFYEEAFGKLALAIWWEKEAERVAKRKAMLASDLFIAGGPSLNAAAMAEQLVGIGWTRG